MVQLDTGFLRLVYEAIGRKDWDALFKDVHPSFELATPDRLFAETYRGREEATRAFEEFFEPYEEVSAEPQEFFERDDRVVVFFLLRSRPRGSSAVVENRVGHLWTIRDGKAVRLAIYPKREEALDAAGISR